MQRSLFIFSHLKSSLHLYSFEGELETRTLPCGDVRTT